MKKVDFVIFYEGIARELDNLCLLRGELESRGYSVALSHFYLEFYAKTICTYAPEVVVTPWLRNNYNIFRLTRFHNWGKKLVNLQWEQVCSNELMLKHDCDIIEEAKKAEHLCWGQFRRDVLIENRIAADRCPVTGVLQQDYCRPELLPFFKDREEIAHEYSLDPTKKWILYISSFSSATMSEKEIKDLLMEFGEVDMKGVDVAKRSKTIYLAE